MSYDFESFLDDPTGKNAEKKEEEEWVEDEYNELISRPHQYIRRKVRVQVERALLNELL